MERLKHFVAVWAGIGAGIASGIGFITAHAGGVADAATPLLPFIPGPLKGVLVVAAAIAGARARWDKAHPPKPAPNPTFAPAAPPPENK